MTRTPHDVVHEERHWRLLRFRGERRGRPIVLVPSLINRWWVLDLLPGKSFCQWLAGRGHDVYVIDWGTPGDEDRHLELEDVADRFVGRAVRKAARLAGDEQVHLLGYCLGGTLTALHAAVRPERIASLTLVAAPIRFADGGLLAAWTRAAGFDLDALCDAGNVRWPLMQAAFQFLKPTLNLGKMMAFLERGHDPEFREGFFALERWGSDNVDFPAEVYRRWVRDLYQEDALVKGTMRLGARAARLDAIRCPTMVVTFEHDHIVPAPCAAAILEHVADGRRHHVQGGHVGAMTSKSAAGKVWEPIEDFWSSTYGQGPEASWPSSGCSPAVTASPADKH